MNIFEKIGEYFREKKREKERKEQERIRREWIEEIEPRNRNFSGYPPDWETRRYEVLNRSNYSCEICGSFAPTHLHHVIPLSKGGDHSISNLQVLCTECHAKQHMHLDRLVKSNKAKFIEKIISDHFGKSAKFKHSKKEQICQFCGKHIKIGELYFSGSKSICNICYINYCDKIASDNNIKDKKLKRVSYNYLGEVNYNCALCNKKITSYDLYIEDKSIDRWKISRKIICPICYMKG